MSNRNRNARPASAPVPAEEVPPALAESTPDDVEPGAELGRDGDPLTDVDTPPVEAPAEVDPVPVVEPDPERAALLAQIDGPEVRTATGRPRCRVLLCRMPEVADDTGLCGGHWSTRADLRRVARRG